MIQPTGVNKWSLQAYVKYLECFMVEDLGPWVVKWIVLLAFYPFSSHDTICHHTHYNHTAGSPVGFKFPGSYRYSSLPAVTLNVVAEANHCFIITLGKLDSAGDEITIDPNCSGLYHPFWWKPATRSAVATKLPASMVFLDSFICESGENLFFEFSLPQRSYELSEFTIPNKFNNRLGWAWGLIYGEKDLWFLQEGSFNCPELFKLSRISKISGPCLFQPVNEECNWCVEIDPVDHVCVGDRMWFCITCVRVIVSPWLIFEFRVRTPHWKSKWKPNPASQHHNRTGFISLFDEVLRFFISCIGKVIINLTARHHELL